MSPYFIYCILGYCITLLYLYLYNIGFLYYTNIQYTQLLYWAILVVHIYYPVSFILGYSSVPVLSNITPFYWATLIEQDFIISPLFSMALSFIFWFSLVAQYYNDLHPVFGLLYYPYYISDPIPFLVYYTRPMFLYIIYTFGLLYRPNYYYWTTLVSSIRPVFTLISLILGLVY